MSKRKSTESRSCIICKEGDSVNNKLVNTTDISLLKDLKEKVLERASLGDVHLKSLAGHFSSLSESDLRDVCYHSGCRKPLANKVNLEMCRKRARSLTPTFSDAPSTSEVPTVAPKRGRPHKIETSKTAMPLLRKKGGNVLPKEKKCMFHTCSFCPKSSQELHKVVSDYMGQRLLAIKGYTKDDLVRLSIAEILEPGDAAALEKYYHRDCLRVADRHCKEPGDSDAHRHVRSVCDAELIVHVRDSLSVEGCVLSMNELNSYYIDLLKERNIYKKESDNHKKYLKELIEQHVPDVEFVQPPNPIHSHRVMRKKSVGQAVEFATTDTDTRALIDLARALRQEVLGARDWKFTGEFNDFENPPMLEFLIARIMYGSEARQISGQREAEVKKNVDVVCQLIVQSSRSQRQVKLKTSRGFKKTVETPLSIGVPLAIHSRVRDHNLISMLSTVYIGSDYQRILNLQKRVEFAVQQRMLSTEGYCLPDFVKRNVPIWFAADNIDFLENTAYGQNTFHGTLLVLFQRDEDGELINKPLQIPSKPPEKPHQVQIKYRDEPEIKLTPIRFPSYSVGRGADLLTQYSKFTHTWALANLFTSPSLSDEPETNDSGGARDNAESKDASDDENTGDAADIDVIDASAVGDKTEMILEVTERKEKKTRLRKCDVMPTWAATQHLLIKNQDGYQPPTKTNVEVVAPLLRTSPTDYGTLYTVLCLAQDISAVVIGPERRTLITLDLDLYQRAIQLKESVKNKNWVLRAGLLHIVFAVLHGLGKTSEGSGQDTIAVDTGIYSSAALRGIYSGKSYKRAVEYHIMNGLAILLVKLDAVVGELPPLALKGLCVALRRTLHDRDPEMVAIYEDLGSYYSDNVRREEAAIGGGDEMSLFFDNYLNQVDALLEIIAAARSRDWEGSLAAIEKNIKYFHFHGLINYARLMPLHLAQMYQLEEDDPTTWEALKYGDFVVTKSMQAFCNLFTDQGLEQEIKVLKKHGALPGITQDEAALDRFVTTTPHLARLVQKYLLPFPKTLTEEKKEHYQLAGDICVRSSQNALKLRNSIILHCEGNPYIVGTPVKNICSSAVIPDKARFDILNYPNLGQELYQKFVDERLLITSKLSIWDRMTRPKFKTFSNWKLKSKLKVGDKVIKLREDRELIGRCLIISQSRPMLLPKLEETIGTHEMSVMPRSMFAPDGTLLLATDKASVMHAVEAQPSASHSPEPEPSVSHPIASTYILDAMALLQAMKKTPGMKKIIHLKHAFINTIKRRVHKGGYTEARILFDQYLPLSLKEKTRAKRATSDEALRAGYEVHDEMNITTVPLRDLLSCSKTKGQLARLLAQGLLEEFAGYDLRIIVSYDTNIRINSPHILEEDFQTHGHEEADSQIPLHVLHCINDCAFRHVVVASPDTDVLVLLLDLGAHGRLGSLTTLEFHTGKGNKFRKIDVMERVRSIGRPHCQGLIGIHNFSGADWGGKFVGVTKKRWITEYFKLSPTDPIVDAFQRLGDDPLSSTELINGELPKDMQPLEHFVCHVYSANGPQTLPKLRWELFRSKNMESEMLPPTRATLLPHIQRTNFVCTVNKAYITTHPVLPRLEDCGWVLDDGAIFPVRCLELPAPKAVLELIKCGCRSSACARNCSCANNNLPCTPLCKCHDQGCQNSKRDTVDVEDEEI